MPELLVTYGEVFGSMGAHCTKHFMFLLKSQIWKEEGQRTPIDNVAWQVITNSMSKVIYAAYVVANMHLSLPLEISLHFFSNKIK